MNTTIKAHFKQATVKGGVAVLQLEVLTGATGAFDVIKQAGRTVIMTIESEQQELDFGTEYEAEPLPFDEEPVERPANVDAETGEIYETIEDEAYMLTEGGN